MIVELMWYDQLFDGLIRHIYYNKINGIIEYWHLNSHFSTQNLWPKFVLVKIVKSSLKSNVLLKSHI